MCCGQEIAWVNECIKINHQWSMCPQVLQITNQVPRARRQDSHNEKRYVLFLQKPENCKILLITSNLRNDAQTFLKQMSFQGLYSSMLPFLFESKFVLHPWVASKFAKLIVH